jgi:hypothetical protein
VGSGALLFSSNATHYWGTVPFRAKMLLLTLAGINMLASTPRSIDRSISGAAGPQPLGPPKSPADCPWGCGLV